MLRELSKAEGRGEAPQPCLKGLRCHAKQTSAKSLPAALQGCVASWGNDVK